MQVARLTGPSGRNTSKIWLKLANIALVRPKSSERLFFSTSMTSGRASIKYSSKASSIAPYSQPVRSLAGGEIGAELVFCHSSVREGRRFPDQGPIIPVYFGVAFLPCFLFVLIEEKPTDARLSERLAGIGYPSLERLLTEGLIHGRVEDWGEAFVRGLHIKREFQRTVE